MGNICLYRQDSIRDGRREGKERWRERGDGGKERWRERGEGGK